MLVEDLSNRIIRFKTHSFRELRVKEPCEIIAFTLTEYEIYPATCVRELLTLGGFRFTRIDDRR